MRLIVRRATRPISVSCLYAHRHVFREQTHPLCLRHFSKHALRVTRDEVVSETALRCAKRSVSSPSAAPIWPIFRAFAPHSLRLPRPALRLSDQAPVAHQISSTPSALPVADKAGRYHLRRNSEQAARELEIHETAGARHGRVRALDGRRDEPLQRDLVGRAVVDKHRVDIGHRRSR